MSAETQDNNRPNGVVLTPEQQSSRRARNIAIGLAIACFIALFYVVTIVKLGGAVTRPPM
jgi:hypothetical protein